MSNEDEDGKRIQLDLNLVVDFLQNHCTGYLADERDAFLVTGSGPAYAVIARFAMVRLFERLAEQYSGLAAEDIAYLRAEGESLANTALIQKHEHEPMRGN